MSTARVNITFRRGDDYTEDFSFVESIGTTVTDLITTSGSTTVTSASAPFVAAHTGKLIATADGTAITDGTTLTYVSPTQATLSANATASGTSIANVAALNCSGYSNHYATVSTNEDTTGTSLTVSASRASVGVFTLSLAYNASGFPTKDGVWDWQVTTGGKIKTIVEGNVKFDKDVPHA